MFVFTPYADLGEIIQELLQRPSLKGAVCGVQTTGPLGQYAYQADIRLMPASNQKLLAVAYALSRLGPDHRFTVRIWREKSGAWVATDGHPTLTFADLANARETLALRPGPIRVNSPFGPTKPPGWEWDDLPNRYAALPSALTQDRGGFELWSRSGKLTLVPSSYGVRAVARSGTERRIDYDPARRTLNVWGAMAGTQRLDTLALPDPEEAACETLGGKPTRVENAPARPADLTLTSKALIDIATECLQKSDNNLAENLLLIAAAKEGPLGRDAYGTASKRLTAFLEGEVGVIPGEARPVDGSGLSRHNLITPRALAKVLEFGLKTWGTQWMDAMATSGKGTLQNRLPGSSFRGKTGSLNSVNSLSGFLLGGENPQVIVLVFNHTIAPSSEIRSILDEIVRKIESSQDGTVFDAHDHREGRHTHEDDSASGRHWDHRLGDDCRAARAGPDRRAQSPHAPLHRTERMAVRLRQGSDSGRRVVCLGMVCPVQPRLCS